MTYILDSQSALVKVAAPLIERRVPYAASLAIMAPRVLTHYRDLPFCLCQPGPEHADGVGNYHFPVLPMVRRHKMECQS